MLKLSKIKPNPNNPRLIKDIKFLKLVKSILTLPEMLKLRPIVLDENNMILGGNMRYKALQHINTLNVLNELESFNLEADRLVYLLDYWNKFKESKEVETIQAKDLTDEQKNEFIIKDNVSFGEMDFDILTSNFSEIDLNDWGFDVPVFEDEDNEIEEKEEKEKTIKTCPHCGEVV